MVLNQECVRELLIFVEQHQNTRLSGTPMLFKMRQFCGNPQMREKFTMAEINTAVRYLHDKRLIESENITSHTDHIHIRRITAAGYDYLGVIRDDTQWHKLKQKFGKIFDSSAPVLVEMLVKGLLGIS